MHLSAPDFCRCAALLQLVLMALFNGLVAASEIYMADHGFCIDKSIISVDGDSYLIYSDGNKKDSAYSSSLCSVRFETKRNDRLCLIFKRFSVKDCSVRLKVFYGNSATGTVAGEFSCRDIPKSSCSSSRFLTLQLIKDTTKTNDYEFELEIREQTYMGDAFTEGIDAFILSIGIIIAIIVSVLVVITVLAIIVVYCCCKQQRVSRRITRHGPKTSSTFISSMRLDPSASPLVYNFGRSNPENALPPYTNPEPAPLSGCLPMELPPAYSPSPPSYQETATTELNHVQ